MKTTTFFFALTFLLSVTVARADEAATINKLINDLNAQAKAEGGEAKVVKTISKNTKVPEGTLQAEKAKTGLSWGEIYIAHAIASGSKKSFDQIAALKKGKSWAKVAQENNVSLGGKSKAAGKPVQAAATPKPSPTPGAQAMPTWKPVRGY